MAQCVYKIMDAGSMHTRVSLSPSVPALSHDRPHLHLLGLVIPPPTLENGKRLSTPMERNGGSPADSRQGNENKLQQAEG